MKQNIEIKQINPDKKNRLKLLFSKISIDRGLVLKVGLPVFILLLLMAIFAVFPLINLYRKAQFLKGLESRFKTAIEKQDIGIVSSEIDRTKSQLTEFKGAYYSLAWTKVLPLVGGYWRDGEKMLKAAFYGLEASEITLGTIKPYADIIGFAPGGKEAQSGEESAQDRMEFVISTLDAVLPKLASITERVEKANNELKSIDVSKYPETLGKYEVRPKLQNLLRVANEAARFVLDTKPVIEKAKYLLGVDKERTYLVLLQNDKELRPTGGFITAYTIMKVTKGKISSVVSSDIYALDDRYIPVIEAPPQFLEFLKGPYVLSNNLRLRDMNYLADFKESMDLFAKESSKTGIADVDGIIAVDTQTLVNILDVLGEVGVSGFGNYNTLIDPECNCPQVVHELEKFADIEGPIVWSENEPGKIVYRPPNSENRKGIIGPLMNSVLANALGQPKEKVPGLFGAIYKSLTEKHVLFYMYEEDVQKALEEAHLAGRIEETEGDYLHINDANLGGRKSNLYVISEVIQDVKVDGDGNVTKTLTLTYANPQDYDGWLNSVLPNWTRIYVPKGATLVNMGGFDKTYDTYDEHGKTVFSGSFSLRPKGVVKIVVEYKLPFKVKGNYRLLIQKQPGTDKPFYTINFGKTIEEFFLDTDKNLELRS